VSCRFGRWRGPNLNLSTAGQIDEEVENDLIAVLDPGANFDGRAAAEKEGGNMLYRRHVAGGITSTRVYTLVLAALFPSPF
jgi:hypothetical protein